MTKLMIGLPGTPFVHGFEMILIAMDDDVWALKSFF
jgi:hypothetical protein